MQFETSFISCFTAGHLVPKSDSLTCLKHIELTKLCQRLSSQRASNTLGAKWLTVSFGACYCCQQCLKVNRDLQTFNQFFSRPALLPNLVVAQLEDALPAFAQTSDFGIFRLFSLILPPGITVDSIGECIPRSLNASRVVYGLLRPCQTLGMQIFLASLSHKANRGRISITGRSKHANSPQYEQIPVST
jgi:hypothetical protein